MSVEENKAVIRRIYEDIFKKGNMALIDEVIATNYVSHAPGGQATSSLLCSIERDHPTNKPTGHQLNCSEVEHRNHSILTRQCQDSEKPTF